MYHYKLVVNGETVYETDDIFDAHGEWIVRDISVPFMECLVETEVA